MTFLEEKKDLLNTAFRWEGGGAPRSRASQCWCQQRGHICLPVMATPTHTWPTAGRSL